jgi:hypothetical protein
MAQYEHLPLYKASMDLAVYLENTVKGFSRYHKYTLGSDLRKLAHRVVMLVIQVNSERDKAATFRELRDTVEQLKVTARMCKEVKAFKSFNAFQQVMESVISVGRQSEGWLKSVRGVK